MSQPLILTDPLATEQLGRRLADASRVCADDKLCIWLHGDLGAGKTSLARGFLRGCGHAGRVPSPTYTLVEPYTCGERVICHLDLYRLQSGAELEFLGVDEMAVPGSVLLIEWPEQGGAGLIAADLEIFLAVIPEGRSCRLVARSPSGAAVLEEMSV